MRVVFDRRGRLPEGSRLVRTAAPEAPVVTWSAPDAAAAVPSRVELLRADSLESALAELADRGIAWLLLEGGATIATAFLDAGLDRPRAGLPGAGRARPAGPGMFTHPVQLPPPLQSRARGAGYPHGSRAQGAIGVFTGIVGGSRRWWRRRRRGLVLTSSVVSADVAVGDSVAVDGCCLTVTTIEGNRLHFDAVPETLARTTLGDRVVGDLINLEPALRVGDRMGGHWVQGHVDGVGEVVSLTPHSNAVDVWVKAPEAVLRYVIEKGSITVNGVSLTVTGFDSDGFGVSLIPHTLEVTNFGRLQPAIGSIWRPICSASMWSGLTAGGLPSEQDER